MSVGRNLQEMENVVTKGAKPAQPMPKLTTGIPDGQSGNWEDLGGPTPYNYRPDDDSAKLKDPSQTLAAVKNVVNQKAKPAMPMPHLASGAVKEETEDEEDLIDEVEEDEDLVAEAKDDDDEEDSDDQDDQDDQDDESGGKGGRRKKVNEAHKEKRSSNEDDDDDDDDEEDLDESIDIEEDVNALLEGEDLSEEFQEKARTIFEAAIRSKVSEIKEDLKSQYEDSLIEEIQNIKLELTERVDSYLEYVADEWIKENRIAVEQGLKTQMTESFLQGMYRLFEENYVSIPEDRYDVVESMIDKLDEMEAKLNEQIQKNVALNKRLAESVADVIFSEVSEGLALSQKDKLASLAENVEFDGEQNYREKLVTLRESYFPTRPTGTQRDNSEILTESTEIHTDSSHINGIMESYLQVLGRVAKK